VTGADLAAAKLDLSQRLLRHLQIKLMLAKTPKTKAALANMIKVQERVVWVREKFNDCPRKWLNWGA
jgi:hypothetical protein